MKLMLCEKCYDLVAPSSKPFVPRWCECRRHAVWWEDPAAGKLVLHDGADHAVKPGSIYDGLPKGGPKAWVIGISNDLILYDLNSPERAAQSLAATPDTYLFKQRNSLVVKFRPLESGDTRWSSTLP